MPTSCGGHARNTSGCGRSSEPWPGGRESRNASPTYSGTGSGRPLPGWLDEKSPVTGDCHAGICGSPGVRFPRATRPDVLGELHPAAGEGGRDTEEVGRIEDPSSALLVVL